MEQMFPLSGYAPGSYQNKCATCGGDFIGDKMARQCLPCAMKATGTEVYYQAVPVEEGLPEPAQITQVLIDSRIPMLVQRIPGKGETWNWVELYSRRILDKGVTHWLKPMWVQNKHMDLMIRDLINALSKDKEYVEGQSLITGEVFRILADLIRERFIPRSYLIHCTRQGTVQNTPIQAANDFIPREKVWQLCQLTADALEAEEGSFTRLEKMKELENLIEELNRRGQ